MHKNATKCTKTLSKWCKNKHGASKIIDTFETYQGVTLGAGAELDVKRLDVHVRVVLEELLKRGPKFSGGSIVIGDQVEELGGDSGVNPLDDR
jgi:hypothetical protein